MVVTVLTTLFWPGFLEALPLSRGRLGRLAGTGAPESEASCESSRGQVGCTIDKKVFDPCLPNFITCVSPYLELCWAKQNLRSMWDLGREGHDQSVNTFKSLQSALEEACPCQRRTVSAARTDATAALTSSFRKSHLTHHGDHKKDKDRLGPPIQHPST